MSRGALRIYLGAAPGVGKTYAMLNEGWRRAGRGTDVVIGLVETHDRPATKEQIRDLPIIERRSIEYRGATMLELDVDAVIARRPRVALIDELAHTNAPGSTNEKRWQDIEQVLAAGIDVITTVNIQHLESLNDVVTQITGIRQRETAPDDFVRRADQIELVDMSPEAIRRRLVHGNIYPIDRVDDALSNFFRPGNLAALRELALLWLADQVEENLDSYLAAHDVTGPWQTRERIAIALSGAARGEALIRRASRIANARHSALLGVHVVTADGRNHLIADSLNSQRELLAAIGGTFHEVVSDDVARGIVAFASAERATQIVVGATKRGRWLGFFRGSITQSLVGGAGEVDIHVIANDTPPTERERPKTRDVSRLSTSRRAGAFALGLVAFPALTAALAANRDRVTLTTITLLSLAVVIALSAIGGFVAAAVAAIAASLIINWYFTEPTNAFAIRDAQDLVSLVVFFTLALLVSWLSERVARRSFESRHARIEAQALARTSAVLVAGSDDLQLLLDQITTALNLDGAALMRPSGTGWAAVVTAGREPPTETTDGTRIQLRDPANTSLVLRRTGPPINRQVLQAFADQIGVGIERQELRQAAQHAEAIAATDEMRTALLRAVSHDLRTPLTSIKAAVSTLLQPDLQIAADDTVDLLQSIDSSTDRLNRVIANLLDLSRLESGVADLRLVPVALEDVVSAAVKYLDVDNELIEIDIPPTVPMIRCDPPLLERVLANVISNALAWTADGLPVRIEATGAGSDVQVRIIDHGPGIAHDQRARAFEPFQRLDDRSYQAGVGLGLAVARGLTTAIGGTIELDDTPGGGLTVVLSVPRADDPSTGTGGHR